MRTQPSGGRRPAVRTALVAGLVATVVLGVPSPAPAGHQHTVKTAPSPSTGRPIEGGGSWIVNKSNGYYIGRVMEGEIFDNEYTPPNDWHYGRAMTAVDMCGWVLPGSLGAAHADVPDSCSTATRERLAHRREFGTDYNAKAHEEITGTSVTAHPENPFCRLHYNYFHGTDFPHNGGHWANRAAGTIGSKVLYRFTTNDGGAVVVRDDALGWGFLPAGCVERPAELYQDDDVP